jgi:hypothetical protein
MRHSANYHILTPMEASQGAGDAHKRCHGAGSLEHERGQ